MNSSSELTGGIYVAGHRGMVGSAIVRALRRRGQGEIITRTSDQLDLRDQSAVHAFFRSVRPRQVYLAAAKVGGIHANDTYRGTFLYDNLMIEANVIEAARANGVDKLLFLGSSCIYPKFAEQPIREDALLTGALEPTNEAYAIAKIAGVKLCDAYRHQYGADFISAMPTNLYGPGDNYDLATSHVLPALVRKVVTAKLRRTHTVTMWGTGSPLREFMHADDLAEACLFLMDAYSAPGPINVGTGEEISIKGLLELVAEVFGYAGDIVADPSKPDGTPRKLMDSSRLRSMGFRPDIRLRDGLLRLRDELPTMAWYRELSGLPVVVS